MLWHLGNTTVRTPYRLRDALRALQGTALNGNLSGKRQENEFALLLHNNGILDAPRVTRGQDASDLGRKWRSALMQLGFITPRLTSKNHSGTIDPDLVIFTGDFEELSGRAYEITPNGYRLANSETITAQQECFLRSLASYLIPSLIERRYPGLTFSPLRFVLKIIWELASLEEKARLTFKEFAFFVQTSSPEKGVDHITQEIIDYRKGRRQAAGQVHAYDRGYSTRIAKQVNRQASTLDDYADLSFRYLKATGLFRTAGRGIALSPSRTELISLLLNEEQTPATDKDYLTHLWRGAELPTDNAASSLAVINSLVTQLSDRGVDPPLPSAEASLPDLENLRHELEAKLLQLDELEYAAKQAEQIDEILAWMEALPSRGSAKTPDGQRVSVPKGEGPAYLEWVVWRAFMAINSLCIPPWEARKFQIDQDFLPVHCAPGRGPDMVFEFENAIIVVEVTLTASSRQEAAEGEPVRRHVAQFREHSEKPVYGLFIAVEVDSNTAHTFRSGDWYLPDDSKLSLDIVPITLDDFKTFLASGRKQLSSLPELLLRLLIECRAKANQDAPQWKKEISKIIRQISNL